MWVESSEEWEGVSLWVCIRRESVRVCGRRVVKRGRVCDCECTKRKGVRVCKEEGCEGVWVMRIVKSGIVSGCVGVRSESVRVS